MIEWMGKQKYATPEVAVAERIIQTHLIQTHLIGGKIVEEFCFSPSPLSSR